MRKIIILISLFVAFLNVKAQEPEKFNIEIEAISVTGAPGVHSFAWAKDSKNRWLIIGGRIDGLHQRQPFAAFLAKDNNKSAFVIDIENDKVYSKSLSSLPIALFDQLQSTNQEFIQHDGKLYVFGGYGFSSTAGDHITFPNLTAINVDSLTNAIINNTAIDTYFKQIEDVHFKVTGGQIGYLDSTFYLVGGQLFDGRYNPMGPDMGPGFTQVYTEEIRKFKIEDKDDTLKITNYTSVFDTDELHRRDYNMSPQIFPNGEKGFTVFSGVFQKNVDLPFLNTVDITPSGYYVKPNFNQYLSQYHNAKLPIFDSFSNTMQTIFFGGMSQFSLGENNELIEDQDVPFVKTISKISRFFDGSMAEIKLPIDMPTLVGAGAEFIPYHNAPFWDNEILKINEIPQEKTLVGYIYGGIESTADNIFFFDNMGESYASSVVFKVYINKSTVGINEELVLSGKNIFNLKLFPNPTKRNLNFSFYNPNKSKITLKIIDTLGKEYYTETATWSNGKAEEKIDVSSFASGTYILSLSNGFYTTTKTFIKD